MFSVLIASNVLSWAVGHMLSWGVGLNTLLLLAILWAQLVLLVRLRRMTGPSGSIRSVPDEVRSYDGPATIPIRQFPQKRETNV